MHIHSIYVCTYIIYILICIYICRNLCICPYISQVIQLIYGNLFKTCLFWCKISLNYICTDGLKATLKFSKLSLEPFSFSFSFLFCFVVIGKYRDEKIGFLYLNLFGHLPISFTIFTYIWTWDLYKLCLVNCLISSIIRVFINFYSLKNQQVLALAAHALELERNTEN